MSTRRGASVALLCALLAPGAAVAQSAAGDARVTALVGLARTARDQGRADAAVDHFRDADRMRPFQGALLVEYFWAARASGARETVAIGERVLAANPRDAAVRDGLIGVAIASGDEASAARLASQGRQLEPDSALWARRLAESHLRAGRHRLAADQFLGAAQAIGGEPGDRAQWAFSLELAGETAASRRAWSDIPETLSSARRDWTESRARAFAPAPAPPVRRAEAPAPTDADVAAAQHRVLAQQPCAVEPLKTLDRLSDPLPLIDAVSARPTSCAGHGDWTSRAVERAIGVNDFQRALALARPVAAALSSPVALRAQLGVLLHWTGSDLEAEPVLRAVVAEQPDDARAVTALIEVLRAQGNSDAAWLLADRAWRHAVDPTLRVGVAEIAAETGRFQEALALARSIAQDGTTGDRAAIVEGSALLALGRAAEARRVLERLLPDAAASLPWMDAVAAVDGIPVALAESARLPMTPDAVWADVHARRAIWQSRLGLRAEADRSLAYVMAADPVRGRIAAAEMDLAGGRPIDAESAFRDVAQVRPSDVRVLEGLATAQAEQGRWDDALTTLATLRERRPDERRWATKEAEWRHRRTPSADTLHALETMVAANPSGEGRRALARAYFSVGQFQRAATALGDPTVLGEADRLLVARSLRAMGRPADGLAVLRAQGVSGVEAQWLAAELEAAAFGPAAAHTAFTAVTDRPDAQPLWFLSWADLQSNGTEAVRILERGAARFPQHGLIQERLAVAAGSAGLVPVAAAAADHALLIDPSRTGAWFVAIEMAATEGRGEVVSLLEQFETHFPVDAEARVGMAEMLAGLTRSTGDPASGRALAWMDAALARDPQRAPAAVARARLLASQGRLADALGALDLLAADRPELPAVLKLRAELLAASGRYSDAVAAYEDYLEKAPGDLAARRQQARVEGWRGAYEASEALYAEARAQDPMAGVVAAEAEAKQAYYAGDWYEAAARYDRWLALDPKDIEARLERAQLSDRLGRPEAAVDAFRGVAAMASPSDVATTAASRIERRRQFGADLFANGQSADAAERQQLLDLVDSGAGLSDDLGLGYLTRARLFGGPSAAQGADGQWSGYHVGVQLTTALAAPLRARGTLASRQLGSFDRSWFGDVGLVWRAGSRLRVSGGIERTLLLENQSTLAAGIHGTGPSAALRWTPSIDFQLDATAARASLSDGNLRQTLRVAASQRVLRGRHEIRVVGITEGLGFRDERPTYFTPSTFWRVDGGAEWRGWLQMPRFFGDRERWVSAGYTFGMDDRSVAYHTARAGLSYELGSGVGVVVDSQITRSTVYNAGRLSIGLRVKQATLPEP